MNQDMIGNWAETLDEARINCKEMAPIALTTPDITLTDAYMIQDGGLCFRLLRGERQIGYKMGFTSKAKMEQMGLNSPINGYLTDKMEITDGGVFHLQNHIHPKIEPEIVFFLEKNLKGKVNRDEALAAVASMTVGLEILDSRFTGFKYFSLPDVVADNCSASEFVVGKTRIKPRDMDIENLKITLEVNGEIVHSALSSSILGNPIESLMALSEMLGNRGLELKAGSVVLAGAATQAVSLKPGMNVSAILEKFGKVSISAE